MKPRSAEFVKSATRPQNYPPPTLPEIAIAGRSNVGKSSLLNAMVGRAGLAKTSNTPGRTQLLNWFRVTPQKGPPLHLVDLPGYGYAKVPKAIRGSWQPMIESYLKGREVLKGVILLIDARRGAQQEEAELIDWLEEQGAAVRVVLTKCDKLPKSKRKPVVAEVKRDLELAREPIATSATKADGLTQLWRTVIDLARGK